MPGLGVLRGPFQLHFVLQWTEVAERGVPSFTVVPRFDVAEDGAPGRVASLPLALYHQLKFARRKEEDAQIQAKAICALLNALKSKRP